MYTSSAYTTRGVASGVTTMPYAGASYTGAASYASVPSYAGITSRGVTGAATYTTQAPQTYAQPATYTSQQVQQVAYKTAAPTMVTGGMTAGLQQQTYPASTYVSGTARGAVSTIAPQTFGSIGAISTIAPQSIYGGATTYAAPSGMYPGSIQATYIGGSNMTAQSAGLLAGGRIVSERVMSVEDYYNNRPEAAVVMSSEVFQPAVVETVQTTDGGFVEIVQGGMEVISAPEQFQTMVEGQQFEGQPAEQPQPGPPRVVIVCTSANAMGDHETGAWSEEITGPYYVFLEAGCEVYIASILGGQVPIDQASLGESHYTENDRRFQEEGGIQFLENSFALSDISPEAIDCVWLAGGHGTCMDFEANLAQFVTDAAAFGRPVGAVCHGVCGLLSAINQDGTPLLAGKQVTGFSNAEEDAVGLSDKVPFLVQQRMEELGALYSASEPWSEYAVADGNIITGQNPQSSVRAAQLCIQAMMPPQ